MVSSQTTLVSDACFLHTLCPQLYLCQHIYIYIYYNHFSQTYQYIFIFKPSTYTLTFLLVPLGFPRGVTKSHLGRGISAEEFRLLEMTLFSTMKAAWRMALAAVALAPVVWRFGTHGAYERN